MTTAKKRAPSPRERARAETTEQIKQIAREHLATDGANLSLRAVARDLGVVSSAVYRYFASRDELLTALIIDAYASLGAATERADAEAAPADPLRRWLTLGHAIRNWALAYPHEYALIYGSPVPGYAAPAETVADAQRPLMVAISILADAVARGVVDAPADRLPRAVRSDVERIAAAPGLGGVPATLLARALSVWAQLFGMISFELGGQYTNGITDLDAFFEHELRGMARHLGLR